MGPWVTGWVADGCFLLGRQGGRGLLWGQMVSGEDAGCFPLKAASPAIRLVFSPLGGFVLPVDKSASCSQ